MPWTLIINERDKAAGAEILLGQICRLAEKDEETSLVNLLQVGHRTVLRMVSRIMQTSRLAGVQHLLGRVQKSFADQGTIDFDLDDL